MDREELAVLITWMKNQEEINQVFHDEIEHLNEGLKLVAETLNSFGNIVLPLAQSMDVKYRRN